MKYTMDETVLLRGFPFIPLVASTDRVVILRELLLTTLVTIFMTLPRRAYKRRVEAGGETLHNIFKYSIILFI